MKLFDKNRPISIINRIKRTYYVMFFIMVIIIIFLIIIQFILNKNQITTIQLERCISATTRINEYLNNAFSDLNYIARINGFLELSHDEKGKLINALKRHNYIHESLFVIDRETFVFICYMNKGCNLPPEIAEEVRDVCINLKEEYFSKVFYENNLPKIIIAVPVRGEDNVTNGAIVSKINLSHLFFIINQMDIGKTGYGYIINRSDNLILAENQTFSTKRVSEIHKLFNNTHDTKIYRGLNDVWVIGSISYIQKSRWDLIVELPLTEAFNFQLKILLIALLPIIIAIVIIGVIRSYIYNSITIPLYNLVYSAKRYSNGDFSFALTADKNNEIGILTNTFNEMIWKIKNLIHDKEIEKEQLLVTLKSIGDGVITTNLEGKIVLMNRVAEDLTGWLSYDAYGREISEIFDIRNEFTGEKVINPVQKVITTGILAGLANHTILISKDGQKFIIYDSAAPIVNPKGETTGVVLVFRDVTDKVQWERELQKTQKMDSLGVLAGGIAHDFNNILTIILGNISLVKLETDKNSENFILLDESEKAVGRAQKLTNQLLTFSRGGAPIRKLINIEQLIREMVTFLLSGSNVRNDFFIQENIPEIEIDDEQIKQAISNIVINALQSMPNGGILKISAVNYEHNQMEILPLKTGSYVKISFEDSGCGISIDNIQRAFDPFFTTKENTMGLGLSISHSIIKKHGGMIKIRSFTGKGTTVDIYLPIIQE